MRLAPLDARRLRSWRTVWNVALDASQHTERRDELVDLHDLVGAFARFVVRLRGHSAANRRNAKKEMRWTAIA